MTVAFIDFMKRNTGKSLKFTKSSPNESRIRLMEKVVEAHLLVDTF